MYNIQYHAHQQNAIPHRHRLGHCTERALSTDNCIKPQIHEQVLITSVHTTDVYGNGIPNRNGNPIGLPWEREQKHRIGNGNKGGEWETTSMGTELPALPAVSIKLLVEPLATCQMPMPFVPSLPTTEI